MSVASTENADLIAHDQGAPILRLILLLAAACVFLWFPFVMTEANYKDDASCLRIGCSLLNPIFKAMPILLWKIILLAFGGLGVFAFIKGLKTRSKRPLVFVMDAGGVQIVKNSRSSAHLAWADVSAISHRGNNLRLQPTVVDNEDRMINITITNWDVSKDQIMDVVRKYRPDLHLALHYS